MRVDGNPIKLNPNLSAYKVHRIIMPVYIPNEEGYYSDAFKIFTLSVNSLLNTISLERTNITIINNASIEKVDEFIRGLQENNLIDQYIYNIVNRGKADAIIGAAKACYEPLITITDADVLFKLGWIQELETAYCNNPRAGNICPYPALHLRHYSNSSTWVGNLFQVKRNKVVDLDTLKWFSHTLGRDDMFEDRDLNNQYFIVKKGKSYLLGAGHFVAMYRRKIFDTLPKLPSLYGLKGGLKVIEQQVDKLGFYKLSIIENKVMHMGNVLESWMTIPMNNKLKTQEFHSFKEIKLIEKGITSYLPFFLVRSIGNIIYVIHIVLKKIRNKEIIRADGFIKRKLSQLSFIKYLSKEKGRARDNLGPD